MYEVRPPTGIMTGQSVLMMPTRSWPGMSAAVKAATTPGAANAGPRSMPTMSARACSVSTSAACSIPGTVMSSMKSRSPSESGSASYLAPDVPIPP